MEMLSGGKRSVVSDSRSLRTLSTRALSPVLPRVLLFAIGSESLVRIQPILAHVNGFLSLTYVSNLRINMSLCSCMRAVGPSSRRNAMCCNETISAPFIVYPPRFPSALIGLLVGALTIFGTEMAHAQETVRIGFSAPITGPFAVFGKQMESALKLFI